MSRKLIFSTSKLLITTLLVMLISSIIWTLPGQNQTGKTEIIVSEKLLTMQDDANKVDTLLAIADQVSDPKLSMNMYHQALAISQKIGYTKGSLEACMELGLLHKNHSEIDSSIYYFSACIAYSKEVEDELLLAEGHLNLANQLRRKGENREFHENLMLALNIFSNNENTEGLVSSYNAMGIFYKDIARYDSAVYYYLKSLKMSEANNYQRGIGPALINLGKIYHLLKDYEAAKAYNLRSIPYSLGLKNQKHVALAYTNIGMMESELSNYDSSLVYFEKAIAIQKKCNDLLGLHNNYINQGGIYYQRGEYRKALANFELALQNHSLIGYSAGFITALYYKAAVLSKLGFYSEAHQLLDSSMKQAKRVENLVMQKSIMEKYIENYVNQGNFHKAFEAQNVFYQIKDSISTQEKEDFIKKITLEYEKEKDQAKILALTNENLEKDLRIRKSKNQRNAYLFAGSAGIFSVFFLLLFFRNKARNEKLIQNQKIEQLEKDKKLMSVQFLMEGQQEERKRVAKELHDSLGVLLSTAKMQFSSITEVNPANSTKIEKATGLLEMAAGELRRISHNMLPGLLSKYGFFEAVEDLIEQINDAGSIDAQLVVIGETVRFSDKAEFMLYRIVQELMNNTLKHANANKIELVVKVYQNFLELNYADDGKGFIPEEAMKTASFGLRSIQSRVNYLGGDIKVVSAPGHGVNYTIKVQLVTFSDN